ncbi:MAG: DNA-packaging protein [Alphaproteobacteria bacterium]|nr:DNA-packaging protein [Alphaproteobacteria bacterium]
MSALGTASQIKAKIREAGPDAAARALRDFWFWAHEAQHIPEGKDWRTWLFVGGRGAGKTRAAAEFVAAAVWLGIARRVGLIGETLDDARNVMVEGPSGLMHVRWPARRPRLEVTQRRLVWPNRAEARWYSAADPEQLRGPEFDLVWADEFGKWRRAEDAMDMTKLALRQGRPPRMMVTTTPRSIKPLLALRENPAVAKTHAITEANPGLSPDFARTMRADLKGTERERQEMDAEFLVDLSDALFKRSWLDRARVAQAPALEFAVVGVDPPVTATKHSDACGIVAAGRGLDGHAYVLGDYTVQGATHEAWAAKVAVVVESHAASRVVVETNQGGDLVKALLERHCPGVRVVAARAARSKRHRADLIQAHYERDEVHHVGTPKALEDEMCVFGSKQMKGRSPDRVDALVWALQAVLEPPAEPRVWKV